MGRRCPYLKVWTILLSGILIYGTFTIFRDKEELNEVVFKHAEDNVPGNPKKAEMLERILHMRKVCSQYPVRRHLTANIGHAVRLFYILDEYNFSYCRVAKVGSTFWTQVFLTLSDPNRGKNQNHFTIPRDQAHNTMKSQDHLLMKLDDKRVHSSRSVMVARNPYSRLFSSYIDQIYLPNKWMEARDMATGKRRRKCGSDVTFEEFLSTISINILKGEKTDLHWTPIFSICLPCLTKVTYLSKQETYDDDVDFILNEVGVDKDIIDKVNKATETTAIEISIKSLVHTYVTKGHDVKKGCISELELASKIWNAFKIQGHIHNDMDFPSKKFKSVTAENIEKVLSETMIETVKGKPLTKTERESQRQAWKVKFWKDVSASTMALVQDAFYEDFYVFQYDLDPQKM